MAIHQLLRWTSHNSCNYMGSGIMNVSGVWGVSSILNEDNFSELCDGNMALIDCWDSSSQSPETIGQTASLKIAGFLGKHTNAYQDIGHLIFDIHTNKDLSNHLNIQSVPSCLLWCDGMILGNLHNLHNDRKAIEAIVTLVKGSSQVQKQLSVFTCKAPLNKLSLGQACVSGGRYSEGRYELKKLLKQLLEEDLPINNLSKDEACIAKSLCWIALASHRKNDFDSFQAALTAVESFPRAISFLSDVRRLYAALSLELLAARHSRLLSSHQLFLTGEYTSALQQLSEPSEESDTMTQLIKLYLSDVTNITASEDGPAFDKEAALKVL